MKVLMQVYTGTTRPAQPKGKEVYHEDLSCIWVANRATPPRAGTSYEVVDLDGAQLAQYTSHECSR